jgi:hypothetical protein
MAALKSKSALCFCFLRDQMQIFFYFPQNAHNYM